MICYFDKDAVNLDHIEEIKNVRPLQYLKHRLLNSDVQFIQSSEYTQQGIYVIEVSKHTPHWCGKSSVPTSINILQHLPDHVVKAVRSKTIRVVIIAIIEGDNFTSKDFDGFMALHTDMINLMLPLSSVLIVSGNLNADVQYKQWCQKNNVNPLIEFLGGIEWDGKDSNWGSCTAPIVYESIKNKSSKSFNSLNRSHRDHRTEHLYYLAKNNLLEDGIVSGGIWFRYSNVKPSYRDVLLANYPRTVDLNVEDLRNPKEIHPSLTFNSSTYTDSLLTVVTESHCNEDGLFITEKTFRAIALGHPFLVVGQPMLLEKLYSMGFKPSFYDCYDSITDNQERFNIVHSLLLDWVNLPRANKISVIEQYLDNIEHNFDLYKKINFKKQMFDAVISSTENYFINCGIQPKTHK